MSSAFINFDTSTPCIFTIDGISKFGVRTDQEFLRITRTLSRGKFEIVCLPVEDPENVMELNLKTTESELQEMGLYGDSLQIAKQILGEYIAYANRVEIGKSGGIQALINALSVHATNENVQKKACRAISVVALNENNKKAFIEQGAIPLLLRAIEMGGDVEIAATEALIVLGDKRLGEELLCNEELNDEILEQELPE